MKRLTNEKGFTLLEVVIVLAVLGVIFLILAPNFSDTITKAKIKSDIQSARVITEAVRLYEAEKGTELSANNQGALVDFLIQEKYLESNSKTAPQTGGTYTYDSTNKIVKVSLSADLNTEVTPFLTEEEKKFIVSS